MPVTTLDLGPVRSIHRGDWSSTATYETSNIVSYLGSSWMMSASLYTVGTAPAVGGAVWKLMAAQGTSVITDATVENAGIVRQATDAEASAGNEELCAFITPYHLQTYGGIPTGVIVMWSGATTAIPTGWALCDGTNGTPNLVDRFIIGAGSTYAVRATGGSTTVTPSGTNASTAVTPSGTNAATTLTVSTIPSHAHSYLTRGTQASATSNGTGWKDTASATTGSVGSSGSHNHTFTGTSASHTHTFTGTAHTNLPPYYALAYIMKL